MSREDYKAVLLRNGFVFQGTQMGFPGRGEQDKYSRPDYKFLFYVTRFVKDDVSLYGFSTGKINSNHFDAIYSHNADDTFADKRGLLVWIDDAFVELIKRLNHIAV